MKKFILIGFTTLLIGCTGDKQEQPKNQTPPKEESQNIKPETWTYDSSKDEMRGTESQFASIISENTVNFEFPYDGGSKLILTLRKNGSEIDVMTSISKGQFLCGINSCDASFKFDSGAIQTISMSEPDNHSPDILFVKHDSSEVKIINSLKQSKKLIVELPFYQEGNKQFTFNTEGLNWK